MTTPACTGGGSGDGDDAARAADQAVADSAVLDDGDFGREWEQLPPAGGQRPRSQRAIARCLDQDPDVLYPSDEPTADSPVFVSPDDQEVSSRIFLASTEQRARRRFAVLTSTDARDCLAEELQRYLEDEDPFPRQTVEIGEVQVVGQRVPDMGDESVAYRISVPLTADRGEVDMHVSHVLVRVGRALLTVQATSLFDPFPGDVLAQLAGEVVARVDEDAVS